MRVLGIETSCDETAAAVVDDERRILGEALVSQIEAHLPFQGVVPEVAARAHLQKITPVVQAALAEAQIEPCDLDGIAATCGPGLIGGVIVGTLFAKAMAAGLNKPFLAVNHLEGHALTPRLSHDVPFPYLLLLVSGGHTQLLLVEDVGQYRRLGTTIDDALGEAFDKSAKMMGLSYPGGPALEQAALQGQAGRFDLPRPMLGRAGCDFSFSGLKTAVRHAVGSLPEGALLMRDVADLAADFQGAVAEVLRDRCCHAIHLFKEKHGASARHFVAAGGVAANQTLRSVLTELATEEGLDFVAPPLKLCTDNGAMIAWAGLEYLRLGQPSPLDFAPRPRWPLDPAAAPAIGAGVKA